MEDGPKNEENLKNLDDLEKKNWTCFKGNWAINKVVVPGVSKNVNLYSLVKNFISMTSLI